MSGIAVNPVRPTTTTAGTQPVRRLADVNPTAARELRAAADAYIASPVTMVQDHGISAVHTTIQAMNAGQVAARGSGVGNPVTDYGNPLRSALSKARSTAVSSTVRNAWRVIRKKQDIPTAVGFVTSDVVTQSAKAVASQLATNLAVHVAARAGAGSFPILIAGMATGMATSYAAGKILEKTGVRQSIAIHTTQLIRRFTDD